MPDYPLALIDCPCCAATMREGDRCPACGHVDAPYCACPVCLGEVDE